MNPIPSRTRPLNSSAPMVLWLKPWESRSLPGLPKTKQFLFTCHDQAETPLSFGKAAFLFLWSSRLSECGEQARLYSVAKGSIPSCHSLQHVHLKRDIAPPAC